MSDYTMARLIEFLDGVIEGLETKTDVPFGEYEAALLLDSVKEERAAAFEATKKTHTAFSTALIFLKRGKRVRRTGWNGKGMWLLLIEEDVSYLATAKALEFGAGGDKLRTLPWIGMKTADDCFVPWLASQTDLLAEDWEVVQ